MASALFGIVRARRRLKETLTTLSARFVTAITESASHLHAAATIGCASAGNARRRAHDREGSDAEWQLPFVWRTCAFSQTYTHAAPHHGRDAHCDIAGVAVADHPGD
jgi:hypothetical protein